MQRFSLKIGKFGGNKIATTMSAKSKKSKQFHIHPFAEVGVYSKYPLENRLGFHFTALHLDRTKEGWLRLYCTWSQNNEKAKGRTKYAMFDGSGGICGVTSEVMLCFNSIKSTSRKMSFGKEKGENWPASITLGIQLCDAKGQYNGSEKNLGYSYKFFENLKYGVLVWFAPEGWNNAERDVPLFQWDKEK